MTSLLQSVRLSWWSLLLKQQSLTIFPQQFPWTLIMIDGTEGAAAVAPTVDGQTKFACVDGPDLDGFKVDFDEAMKQK